MIIHLVDKVNGTDERRDKRDKAKRFGAAN